jgi:hypothetical protein
MTTNYGMPFFLEDKTGRLTGSDFVDINDRLRLRLRCTAQEPTHTAYMVHDVTHGNNASNPLIALAYGPDNSLGTITIGPGGPKAMKQYLVKLTPLGRLVPIRCFYVFGSDFDVRCTAAKPGNSSDQMGKSIDGAGAPRKAMSGP